MAIPSIEELLRRRQMADQMAGVTPAPDAFSRALGAPQASGDAIARELQPRPQAPSPVARPNVQMGLLPPRQEPVAQARPAQPAQQPGFFSRVGQMFQNPEAVARLAMIANSLSFQPSQGFQTAMQGIIDQRRLGRSANQTAEYFRRIGKAEIADLIEGNPEIASSALEAAFKEPTAEPALVREFLFAKTQNKNLTFEDFLALKRSAGTTVTVGGDPDYAAEAYAKAIPERFDAIVDRGASARRQLSDLTVLGNLLDGKQTGGFAETKASAMQFADRLGLPVNESDLADLQSIQALSSRLVAEELRLNKGPQTDFDAEFTGRFLPGLGQQPEANKAIISYMNSRNLLDAVLGRYVTDNRKFTTEDTSLLAKVEGYRTQLGSVVKVGDDFVTFEEFYNENRQSGASDENILIAWEKEHRR